VSSVDLSTGRGVHFVSLGCPKNRVDSEVMLGVLADDGYTHVADPAEADVIVVNTCGFIEEAKKESIDTIFEMAQWKSEGRCRKLVVTGCLVQRHPEELAEGIPEIDHLLGSSDMMKLKQALGRDAVKVDVGQPADWLVSATSPRVLTTRGASAYLKIAEGCNRTCSFCVIPELRGKQRSRTIEDVVREAEELAGRGVLELNLVSQDTVAYGRDLETRPRLAELVRRVADVPGIAWVRLHYLYPETLDEALVELLADHPRVLPYVDMPLQHSADAMLRRMRRGHGGARLRQLVERLRERVPNLVFRTAFIVGHPGETDEEFADLEAFIKWADFDRVGFFRYSDEESARSFKLLGKVDPKTTKKRLARLQTVQRKIQRKKTRAMIGSTVSVLVEGPSEEHEHVLVGRHGGQAPEIDGHVFLSGGDPQVGTLCRVEITQAADCDLVGEILETTSPARPARPAKRSLRVV
jgi:ribosomal protein S12 methylthiotransferase